jgi:NADPH:quinone reductase-like Zn-dependent oxidoreductase
VLSATTFLPTEYTDHVGQQLSPIAERHFVKTVRLTETGSYDGLALLDEAVPTPGPTDVLIRVHAASLNFRDTIIAKGTYPGPLKDRPVPLSDGAGEVVAVGREVSRIAVGDRVTANCHVHWIAGSLLPEYRNHSVGMTLDGMLSEYALLHENAILRIPDYLSYVEAASLPCAAVSAWTALHVAEPLRPGQTVLVQGTGGVALFGLQIARTFGARVLAITSSELKAQKLRKLGADEVVNYNEFPDWSKQILEITDGRGVDKVVEIGGEATIQQSAACTRIGGEIGLVGFVSGFGGGLAPIAIMSRALQLKGVSVGPRQNFEALLAAMAVSETRPVIDSVYPFTDYKDAYRHLESGSHVGKVAIELP